VSLCFSATGTLWAAEFWAPSACHLDKGEAQARTAVRSAATLFAVHQFIEGFVWLGLDGILSPAVAHNMGAAFILYAQGLLPFLLPLSVLLFEPDVKSRRRMLPFVALGGATALYTLWGLTPIHLRCMSKEIVLCTSISDAQTAIAVLYVIATCGSLFFSKVRAM